MAGKYTDDPSITVISGTEIIPATQTGVDKKWTFNDILSWITGSDRTFSGSITLALSKSLNITGGSNQRAGNASLVGGTIAVPNTSVTVKTLVILSRKDGAGGTLGNLTYTISAGVGFTVNSTSALDVSVVTYSLIELI